jgi:nicotinamidase-related amidase
MTRMMMTTALEAYSAALSHPPASTSSRQVLCRNLCGRIIRGRKPEDFLTLTDDPNRKIVMLVGPDGLETLLGRTGYEMLVTIGYTADHIKRKVVDEGNSFKLAVFAESDKARPATWDAVADFASEVYPDLAAILRRRIPELKGIPFTQFERDAGFTFADVDKAGPNDLRFMTADRLRTSGGSAWEVRAFLYFTLHLRELFAGDGYTYTKDGQRGLAEFIVLNKPISELGESVLVDLEVEIPNTGATAPGGRQPIMATKKTTAQAPAYELPIPGHWKPGSTADWKAPTNYKVRAPEAWAWSKKHGIKSPATDRLRVALLLVDCQLTFCHPDFELFVGGRSGTGAVDDVGRMCEFIYRNLGVLTSIHPTLDTHRAFQIFHSTFLVDEKGNHPDPRFPLPVTAKDIADGKWRVDPRAAFAVWRNAAAIPELERHLAHYARSLESGGKYSLMVWPFHAMLGGLGHALVPALEEAIFFHSLSRGVDPGFQIKGGNPLTENYSVLRPEVLTGADGRPLSNASKNTRFLETLLNHDVVIIAGEAKSHCVAWTIQDLLNEINAQDPALVKKCYLLGDCTSSVVVPGVVDFTDAGNEAFARFEQAGMSIVDSTTPISEWPGIDKAKLGL